MIHVTHIYHGGNDMVDELAKFGHCITCLVEWEDFKLFPSLNQVMIERECTHSNTI